MGEGRPRSVHLDQAVSGLPREEAQAGGAEREGVGERDMSQVANLSIEDAYEFFTG